MKDKTACFTGHRDIPPLKRPGIKHRLEREIERSIQAGYLYFGAGGALGFDTLAAQTVLKLKERYPDIKLILVLPCKTQTSGWKQTDIDEYERIKEAADKVVYASLWIQQSIQRDCNPVWIDYYYPAHYKEKMFRSIQKYEQYTTGEEPGTPLYNTIIKPLYPPVL